MCIYFNHHLCLDNKYEKFSEASENISFLSIWGMTTTKFQFCAVLCVCEQACVRFVFLFLDVFSFGRIEFFYFRFVCIRWYRFLSHLCRSLLGFGFQDGGEASERFTQTNRRNHYTLWNLIFCFLSERFLWNRNQSLCPCAYTTTQCALHMHIRHIILHFRLFIGYENENEFRCFCCLDLCVLCWDNKSTSFWEKKKFCHVCSGMFH